MSKKNLTQRSSIMELQPDLRLLVSLKGAGVDVEGAPGLSLVLDGEE